MAVACCRHNPIPSLCRREERLLRLRIFDAALRMTRFGVVTSNHRAFFCHPERPTGAEGSVFRYRTADTPAILPPHFVQYRRAGACPPPPIRFHVHTADTPAIQPLRHGGTQGPALHTSPLQRPSWQGAGVPDGPLRHIQSHLPGEKIYGCAACTGRFFLTSGKICYKI